MENIMKYILLSLVALITLSSCSDDRVTDYDTFVYSVTELDWNLYEGNGGYFANINAPEINYEILDYGYFITYLNIGTDRDPKYIELPQTQVYTDGDGVTYSIELVPTYSFEKVVIEYFDTHPAGQQFPPFNYSFRTVIVSEPYIVNGIKSGEIDTEYESVVSKMEDSNIKFQMIDSQ